MRWLEVSVTCCVLCTCGCGAIEDTWNPPQEVTLAPATTEPSATAPASAPAPARPPRTTNLVRLSAGTSLPQSLPTGTTMHFSVDYSLRQQPTQSSAQFFWIIERTIGPPITIPVTLKTKGTLIKLTAGWRPEHAPFRCYIAIRNSSGKMTPVSTTVPLT
jgi:hypothetical protein